ncbi:glutamate synthase large subunit [Niallia endozanthoxylica]|uniref:Glutamate synthase large subunit n=1 Tax=Niallia endozanthoxylica TaxID=2036016 RepID=A0A5J5HBB9_9BACI|nr:glutamate synthase large subunit [Niallia endozanthoxylica]KAA9018025.1 glutamate synthase large subunit [Niallia endozanthoxylica]
MNQNKPPVKQGLYNPINERDACGIGLIANIKGNKEHTIVQKGLTMLSRMEHRGGQGSDRDTGDGAGLMTQIPHEFFTKACPQLSAYKEGDYGVGMIFLPQDSKQRKQCETAFNDMIVQEGLNLLGWRTVSINDYAIGTTAKSSQPFIRQVFIGKANSKQSEIEFDQKLYMIRKRVEKEVQEKQLAQESTFYVASLSSRTIVYKGMLTPDQIQPFYLDLQDESFTSSFALVHSRYSTNTFPSWERAHPNRYLIHNGEINTLKGNVNWMKAREKMIDYSVFGEFGHEVLPIIDENGSDSSSFDNCLEFLHLTGRSLAHAVMMMVPEPWEKDDTMDDSLKAFYEYHSHLMEPWDGPAAFAFTNGKQIGAMLDRNGLRPARYYVTADDQIILASEAGVLEVEEERILEKGKLSPGDLILVDLEKGCILNNDEAKRMVSHEQPYRQWLNNRSVHINELLNAMDNSKNHATLKQYHQAYGFTQEELNDQILPMAKEGKDPIGSMGNDTPLAVLSNHSQLLYNYFQQVFAQVTNPPIDAIREHYVTSTATLLGPEGSLLNPSEESCQRIRLDSPILTNENLNKLRFLKRTPFQARTFPILFQAANGESHLESSLTQLFQSVDEAVKEGVSLIILSDKGLSKEKAAIPALLAVSGLHQHLIRQGTRTKVSIIVETGEPRDIHHLCMLIGYGADAINPYLAFATIEDFFHNGKLGEMELSKAINHYIKAVTKGIVKVLSKMGISTIQSYRGAQIFEAVGIHQGVIDKYFNGTSVQLGGIKLETIATETLIRHEKAFENAEGQEQPLFVGGDFKWRKGGEEHAYSPDVIRLLKQACRTNDYEQYKTYTEKANESKLIFVRDLFSFKKTSPIPIEEVEPIESIVKRFKTGAMSYGSLSQEAHETLAIAMNRLGGKSNSGEGGEHPDRYLPDENGDLRRSAIKQVASARFGVNSHYLMSADEIQIKMAQGAKPGEGGHLPGSKVYPWIAEVRGSTPGIGLISPPPHHDIYSIEDLAQLIHDLKNANPSARISVKLVSKAGVGTIAAGVAKGLADVILISGADGGTGAAPRTSIKRAGMPWELGLAETHQTLLLNGLRDRVVLEADGKLMTGRDVVMAALLGAEEFGFATAPLVVLGCVLVRQCQNDTCPVGIATQNPELRKKFLGKPEHVENFMRFIAQDVREIMANLGIRTINELVGRTDLLTQSEKAKSHWKVKDLDVSAVFYQPDGSVNNGAVHKQKQNHGLEKSLDYRELLSVSQPALERKEKVEASFPIQNINRTVGTLLGSEITKRYGANGLPENTIRLNFTGTAGQSFGAFIPKGLTLDLEGEANDYVGKGLSGGKIIVKPSEKSVITPEVHTIIGNVAFYGGTAGEAYIRGLAGDRFCVRNSGVHAVVEGVGNHGCEYMTGGRVVVLGSVGKNFAAGMTGGIAYVYSEQLEEFKKRCNQELVNLEALEEEQDGQEVYRLVQNHYNYTGSIKAFHILNNWKQTRSKWVKVIPKEFKGMLQSNSSKFLMK